MFESFKAARALGGPQGLEEAQAAHREAEQMLQVASERAAGTEQLAAWLAKNRRENHYAARIRAAFEIERKGAA